MKRSCRTIMTLLTALIAASGIAQEVPTDWSWRGADLAFPEGRNAAWIPTEMLRLYKVQEDEDARDEEALRVYVDQRILAEADIPILRSPSLRVPVGVYRVTVRMKMTGMLNAIGNAVRFTSVGRLRQPDVGGHESVALRYWEPTLHGYHFMDEDLYQEFSYLHEVVEPDYVTGRPLRQGAKNPFGALFAKADMEAWARGEGNPWERQAAAAAQVAPTEPAQIEALRQGPLTVSMDFLQTPERGFGRIQPTIRHFTIDWLKVERVPEPEHIVVRKVVPTKLLIHPAAETEFQVWLHNRSGEPRQGRLLLTVRSGLNDELVVGERQVELGDHAYAVESFTWSAPDRVLWGCHAVAELLVDGDAVSSAEDVFTVHWNPWAVMNLGGANRWTNPYSRLPSYQTYMEMFGGTPGDGLKPWPDDPSEPYISGMSDFKTHMDVQKMFVQHNRSVGVASYLYIQPANGTSVFPQLLYEKHPEWFSSPLTWTDQIHDNWVNGIANLRKAWHAGEELVDPPGLLHIEAPVNYAVPYMFENLLDGALKNLLHVGWDGIRWDADFPVRTVVNKHIPFGPGSPEADRQMSAAFTKRFKKTVREVLPGYTEGANIGTPEQVWNRKFVDDPEEVPTDYHDAFLADGASAMSEDWMSAYIFTDPRNIIRDYYWGARRCAEWCRERGGFWHSFPPERDSTPYFTQSMIYYNLLIPLAGGSYPGRYSCTPGSETGTAHFVTRFSEFLYDLELQPLEDALDRVRIDADQELWYADGTRWRDLPDGRRRYIIPLINPPTIERFLLRDRFSELPEPLREPFAVEIDTPEGFSGARVHMLTAEPRTAVVELAAEADDELVYVEVPDLTIYRVLVVEFSKEAN